MSQRKTPTASRRMKAYRQRLRDAGLRPVQLWVPDVSSPEFVEACRRQALAVAASDPAGDELLAFAQAAADWPEFLIRRGQFVTAVVPGDFGKPRPALIIQSDLFAELPSAVICPLTTTLRPDAGLFRLDVAPTVENGLRAPSQLVIDKITVIPVGKLGPAIGVSDSSLLVRVNRALALFLGIV